MARSPGENGGPKWLKPAAAALAITGAGAWMGAEPLARAIIGDPEMPSQPAPPQRVTAQRGPMEVVVGFDTTRSPIMNDLPGVTAQTRRFFEQTGVLRPGDEVSICTFAEHAKCQTFTLPQDRAGLTDFIGRIGPEAPRRGMQTHVHKSVNEMVAEVGGKTGTVLAWTDGIDNDRAPKSPLPAGHPPVTIVVPKPEHVTPAQSVERTLGDTGVDVKVARTDQEFGALLDGFAAKLDRQAQAIAQAAEDARYAEDTAKYQKRLAKYERLKASFAARKKAVEAQIRTVKNWIKGIAASAVLIAIAGLGTILYLRNRPKTHGWILDVREAYPETYRIPQRPQPIRLQQISRGLPGGIMLSPKKDGLHVGTEGNRLRSGTSLAPGVYWFAKEPDPDTVDRLTREHKVRK